MMLCNVCESSPCDYLGDLKPYQDMDWHFEIFSCSWCGSRFALRNPEVNYYELLHTTPGSSYSYHYDLATKVKGFLQTDRLNQCERYLRKASYKYGEVIDFVKKKNQLLSILEIGCSTGFMTAFFRARGHEAEGVDVSESAIRYATSSFGRFYSSSPLKESYDVIFHLGLIGCVDHPKTFLSDTLRLLKSRGEMIFNAPNVESPEQFNELWVSTPPPDLISLFHEKSFQIIVDHPFGAEVRKVYPKSEVVHKNLKEIFRKTYASYPISFRSNRVQPDENIRASIKRCLKKLLWFWCGVLVDLHMFKKYESEYGLMVTIHRRKTGEHD
jgi:SAM-dependent methyltransferase